MRQKVLLFIFFISLSYAFSQDSIRKLRIGAEFSWGVNTIGNGNYLPGITLSKSRHSFFAGPMLVNRVDPAQHHPLVGLQCGYQIYPNGLSKIFSLFFEYDFNYLDAKIVDNVTGPTNNPNGGIKKRNIDFYFLYNYFSYGFRCKIIRGFHLKTNVGLGFGWKNQTFTYHYWNGQVFGDSHPSAYFGLGALLKFGIGYDFSVK